jgi:hypothetical protein
MRSLRHDDWRNEPQPKEVYVIEIDPGGRRLIAAREKRSRMDPLASPSGRYVVRRRTAAAGAYLMNV